MQWTRGIACSVLLVVGCSKPEPAETVTHETVCDAKYDSTMEQGLSKTKRVALEGYFGPPTLFTLCSDTCSFPLFADAERKGKSISVSLKLGTDDNQLEPLPDDFAEKDFKLHTNDGTVVGMGERVRVTGGRLGTAAENTCQIIGVDLIEKPQGG